MDKTVNRPPGSKRWTSLTKDSRYTLETKSNFTAEDRPDRMEKKNPTDHWWTAVMFMLDVVQYVDHSVVYV